MSADRVAAALAFLEALEGQATPGPWAQGKPQCAVVVVPDARFNEFTVLTGKGCTDAALIVKARNSFPALLKLADAANEVLDGGHHELRHQKCGYCGMTWPCPMVSVEEALNELAEAVLG